MLIDEFTTKEQIIASGKGLNRVDALRAIDKRRETLKEQSMSSGNTYANRMQSNTLDVQTDYYSLGSQKRVLADEKVQKGANNLASKLWE
jgi:predicted metalloprotease with PDZ domain